MIASADDMALLIIAATFVGGIAISLMWALVRVVQIFWRNDQPHEGGSFGMQVSTPSLFSKLRANLRRATHRRRTPHPRDV
jgi:hypothetical protein